MDKEFQIIEELKQNALYRIDESTRMIKKSLADISEEEDPKLALEEFKKDQSLDCIVFAVDAERERISLKLSE